MLRSPDVKKLKNVTPVWCNHAVLLVAESWGTWMDGRMSWPHSAPTSFLICADCSKSREADRVAEDEASAAAADDDDDDDGGEGPAKPAEASSDDEPIKAPTELLVEVNLPFVQVMFYR